MYIFAYLRASTTEQDAKRAQDALNDFVQQKGFRVAGWYIENESGASLQRPELLRMLTDAQHGDAILIEQVDRLSRLNDKDWQKLKAMIHEKELKVISLDLPTSHLALHPHVADDFTSAMFKAINNMMLDMLAAISRKDYEDRRRRQAEGIRKAKEQGKYRGRIANIEMHERVRKLRLVSNYSINETAQIVGVSARTVIRICKQSEEGGKLE